jgi:hypothetical protein
MKTALVVLAMYIALSRRDNLHISHFGSQEFTASSWHHPAKCSIRIIFAEVRLRPPRERLIVYLPSSLAAILSR